MTDQDIILHHYDTSPFSEKVRIFLGMKNAAWGSVAVPRIMPKPDLIPLTGGYRRTPVLQIGADVYCDTQAMIDEIEARLPQPRLVHAADWGVNQWADKLFFHTAVPVIFGQLGDHVPQAFIKDREALSGRPFDVAAMKQAVQPMSVQFRAHVALIEQGLTASDYLSGAAPGLADAAAFMNLWFLESNLPSYAEQLLHGLDRTRRWKANIAAVGHGRPHDLSGADALAIARSSTPTPPLPHDPSDPLALKPGAPIFVMADDYGRDRIEGVLVSASARRLTIAREDEAVGRVHLHFPRIGYVAGPA